MTKRSSPSRRRRRALSTVARPISRAKVVPFSIQPEHALVNQLGQVESQRVYCFYLT